MIKILLIVALVILAIIGALGLYLSKAIRDAEEVEKLFD